MTDHYAVFGNPVAHSMSPMLHAYFAELTSQDMSYDKILVPEDSFASCADEFFKNGGKGANVTVPCKLDAYSYADTLTPYAEAAGAVNTLKLMDDGRILGDNTDGRGLVSDLLRTGCVLKGSKILIIGAGGASKGIVKPILDESPCCITIVNRTVSKAQEIAGQHDGDLRATSFEDLDGRFDVIINATSLSLKEELPNVSDDILQSAFYVYDLMYKKEGDTIFTKHARNLGVQNVHAGFGMLVGQAVLSFELWRNAKVDFNKAIEHFKNA
ncbi:MAG: shikimate dehydrogenase [Succinivibrio sp.]